VQLKLGRVINILLLLVNKINEDAVGPFI